MSAAPSRLIGMLDLWSIQQAQQDPVVVLERAIAAGLRQVMVRVKGCDPKTSHRVDWSRCMAMVEEVGGRVIAHTSWLRSMEPMRWPPYVHASVEALRMWDTRMPSIQDTVLEDVPRVHTKVGASVHNHEELALALSHHVAWVLGSPFAVSSSKPGYGPTLGLSGIHRLVQASSVPVFALAGVTSQTVSGLGAAGAAGCVVMGMLTQDDATAQIDALLNAMENERWTHPTPW